MERQLAAQTELVNRTVQENTRIQGDLAANTLLMRDKDDQINVIKERKIIIIIFF